MSQTKMNALMKSAFSFHILIETIAAINFFLRPSATISTPQPHSHGVIRQYSLLLLATNMIVYSVIHRAIFDTFTAQVAAALTFYHVGPLVRAVSKIRHGKSGDVLGGATLHALVHLLCAVCLVGASFGHW